jgi:hypothetical protein
MIAESLGLSIGHALGDLIRAHLRPNRRGGHQIGRIDAEGFLRHRTAGPAFPD